MGIMKTLKKPEIKYHHKLIFELSMIISLAFIILSFKFFPNIESKKQLVVQTQELFKLEEIVQTKIEKLPPPAPKQPTIIIQAPTDEVLKDIEIESTELDVNEQVTTELPPPKVEKKEIEKEPVYFVAVEEMPEPIGGIVAIQEKIKYPEIAKRAGIEGKVYVKAFVDESGNVIKVECIKGIGGGCDEAAMDAVKQTKFKPGKQRGKPVKVQVLVPIKFTLKVASNT